MGMLRGAAEALFAIVTGFSLYVTEQRALQGDKEAVGVLIRFWMDNGEPEEAAKWARFRDAL
ncbi:hypothetical protein Cs7R123_08030 [Catellatospora sp. TT07R-123]|uniref:hypothetical protein n=1 Tax=Catellatospora sp. TT07R-123 TaxID=2733863 RepID=UPI001B117935|nr:hypothetical protein [Catellatospora sp. TT07R-123]GHJ43461.1 hypothetical protein Cs7R123_08030 [Catellatospora sp. TT07R-123]